jgi:tRNA pseudouridine55 synthase
MSGILNINKPAGMTSHDVVNAVRRASGQRRVGHAGTLDPIATGVLLVCVGNATRVSRFLTDSRKTYRADIHLGIATDTDDAEGQIIYQAPEVRVSREEVEEVLRGFVGTIQQVPPAYSAIKKDGQPMYKLARRGVKVQPEPRTVEIYRLEVTEWDLPRVQVEVECGKGTYVRALARDLGERLGCGAHVTALVRLASGRFTLDRAESLETVEEAFREGYWMYLMHPLDEALLDFEAMVVGPESERRIRNGQQVPGPAGDGMGYRRAYSTAGNFIGLLRYDPRTGLWQPDMVFPKPGGT